MNCLDKIALTEYLQGKLEPERLLEASEHICNCARCRESLKSLESYAPAAAHVRDSAFGVTECPEYEELSAYVDGSLAAQNLAAVDSHIGQCDLCRSDVVNIRAMRARAELAEPIHAKPVSFKRGFSFRLFPAWQKTAAAVAVSAVIVGAVMINKPVTQPVAVNPDQHKPGVSSPQVDNPGKTPEIVAVNPDKGKTPAVTQTPDKGTATAGGTSDVAVRPTPEKTSQVNDEKINLASLGANGDLEARLEKALQQKLKSGATSVDKPYVVALAPYTVRQQSQISELAPKPVSPAVGIFKASPNMLRWKPVEGAVSYRVTIREDNGHTVASQVVEDTAFALPVTLERGRIYNWQVESNFGPGGNWHKSRAVAFRVISDDENWALEKARAEFAGRPEVLGTVYESLGLYEDAVRQFEKYSAHHPSSLAHKMLREAREKLASLQ